jgi:diguanylate cyclase (GGDEF)-like protein
MAVASSDDRHSEVLVTAGQAVLVALVYFAVAKVGLQLSFVKGNVTPIFPAAGVAVAALTLGGLGLWPGVFFGALAAHLTTDVDVGTALAMSAGGPLAAAGAAAILRAPSVGFSVRFTAVRDAVVFIAAGVLLPATVSAVCGVTALFVGSGLPFDDYPVALGSWWVGDAIGAMVAGSLILTWWGPPARVARSAAETALLLMLPVLSTGVLFRWAEEGEALVLPLIVATAVRLQTRWSTLCVAIVSLLAAGLTVNGFGPFVESTENESLVQLSLFLGTVTLTTLVLSAAIAERDVAGDQAHHDELTGLPNRLYLYEQLDAAIARRQPFSLLFIDVDGLKRINDTLGHDHGDALLAAIGRRLTSGLRRGDFAARLAGDEFTVVAFETSTPTGAIVAGERLLEMLSTPFELLGSEVTVSASIGVAVSDLETALDAATLMRRADDAMYAAKRAGGSRVVL